MHRALRILTWMTVDFLPLQHPLDKRNNPVPVVASRQHRLDHVFQLLLLAPLYLRSTFRIRRRYGKGVVLHWGIQGSLHCASWSCMHWNIRAPKNTTYLTMVPFHRICDVANIFGRSPFPSLACHYHIMNTLVSFFVVLLPATSLLFRRLLSLSG